MRLRVPHIQVDSEYQHDGSEAPRIKVHRIFGRVIIVVDQELDRDVHLETVAHYEDNCERVHPGRAQMMPRPGARIQEIDDEDTEEVKSDAADGDSVGTERRAGGDADATGGA